MVEKEKPRLGTGARVQRDSWRLEMTPKEHSLLIFMFALQLKHFNALIEILKSRGVLDEDDLKAFDALVWEQERGRPEGGLVDAAKAQYDLFAKALGVQTGLL
jgi:hypothetical protein